MFDNVEVVLMDGNERMLPWMEEAKKVRKLFKLCKKTNKYMFAAGLGMAMLTYYCATNCVDIHVINGNERGGSIDEINNVPEPMLARLTKGDVFLDYATGDYYSYKHVGSGKV